MNINIESTNTLGMWIALIAWIISIIAFNLTDGQFLRGTAIVCLVTAFIGTGLHFVMNWNHIIKNKAKFL